MALTKRQILQREREETLKGLKIHVKTAAKECGYTVESFAERLGMSRPTFDKKLNDPKQFTIENVNMMCKFLPIEEKYERMLRGYES